MSDYEHRIVNADERRLELLALKAAGEWVELWEQRPDGNHAALYDAICALARWHGSMTHLLADLDQELADHGEPAWVARTWKDVVTGDHVRLGDEVALVVTRYRPPDPDGKGADADTWHVISGGDGTWAFQGDRVVRSTQVVVELDVRPGHAFLMDRDGPVEILLAESEVAAIEAIGWSNRARQSS